LEDLDDFNDLQSAQTQSLQSLKSLSNSPPYPVHSVIPSKKFGSVGGGELAAHRLLITMNYIALFFAGAFLCNCIPHLTAALRGELFPSPFAKPPGKGDSSPIVNFLWGFFNFVLGLYLLSRNPVTVDFNPQFLTLMAGALLGGIHLSLHFGKVQRNKAKR
jgi:hypothetical protein